MDCARAGHACTPQSLPPCMPDRPSALISLNATGGSENAGTAGYLLQITEHGTVPTLGMQLPLLKLRHPAYMAGHESGRHRSVLMNRQGWLHHMAPGTCMLAGCHIY